MTEPHRPDEAPAIELRSASDMLLQRLDRLYELERRKRELTPDNPEFMRIAHEVEDVARATLGASGLQVELATEVAAAAKQGQPAAMEPIRDIPPHVRDAMTILSDWRAAERRLAAAALGSEEERSAREQVERLRAEYRHRMAAGLAGEEEPAS